MCCEDTAHKEAGFQESHQQIQTWVDLNPRKEREKVTKKVLSRLLTFFKEMRNEGKALIGTEQEV